MPSPNRNVDVAVGSAGTVGVVSAGEVDVGYAQSFLGQAPATSSLGRAAVARIAVRDEKGIVWDRHIETNGYSAGLALTGTHLVTGTLIASASHTPQHESLFEQVGVTRPPRSGRPATAVGLGPSSEADYLLTLDSGTSGSEQGAVIGRSNTSVFTLSGLHDKGRVVAWRDQRQAWTVEPANARILNAVVVDDLIALCVGFKGKEMVLSDRPAIPVEGYADEAGVLVLWLSAPTGKVVTSTPLRGRVKQGDGVECGRFTAVRAGAIVPEYHREAGRVDFRLVRREGADDPVLLSVAHEDETLQVASDGQAQVVVVDQNFESGADRPYPVTLTVVDADRRAIRWTGRPPEGVEGFGAVALQGDLLVYAGWRTGAMVVEGKSRPKPERDAGDAGIVVAMKLPPLL